jgi:hypothetical protein
MGPGLVWGLDCQGAPFFLLPLVSFFGSTCAASILPFSNQHAAIKPFLVHFFLSGHFFCSTAPQAFFRPNHKSMQPARTGHVKAGRSSRPPSGSAFT